MKINKDNYHIEHFINARCANGDNDNRRTQLLHLKDCITALSKTDGLFLEFGVHKGDTVNFIADKFTNKIIHGFDSFEGLPEDWFRSENRILKKSHFKLKGILPKVRTNVKLYKGWFENTLPEFVANNKEDIAFLHIDCDLYSSTTTVLDNLNKQIVEDTTIVFDEFYPFRNINDHSNWANDEFKALKDWITKNNREFEILSRSETQQVAIKILK